MNKREVVWLIVRLIGVAFVYLAINSVFGLIGSVSTLYSLPAPTASTGSNTNSSVMPVITPDIFAAQPNNPAKNAGKPAVDPISKKAADDAVKNLLLYIFLTALYAAIGYYLLRDGRILFTVLNREDVIVTDRKEINSLGIFDTEK